MAVDRDEFYRKLTEAVNNKKAPNSLMLSNEKYFSLIDKIKVAKTATKKSTADYRRLKKYEIVETPKGDRLCSRSPITFNDGTAQIPGEKRRQMLVPMDEMYDIISDYHIKLNHGGRSRMMVELKRQYKNITAESVLVYLSLCSPCKKKSVQKRGKSDWTSSPKTNEVDDVIDDAFSHSPRHFSECSDFKLEMTAEEMPKSKITSFKYPELYSRGQVDVLGVTNEEGDEYKYLMVYRNFATKYINLKPMKALSVAEAVDVLLDIFLTFGAPNILQSKNGLDLIKPICRRLSTLFPDMKVLASERVFAKNDFKGKSNEDILKKLNEWLVKSQNTKWQEGVKIVQYELNTTFNEVLCRTPSEMVFGQNPTKGVAAFMPQAIYEDLVTEQDLITVFKNREKSDPIAPKQLQLEESLMLPCDFIKLESEMVDENEDTMTDDEIDI